MYVCAHARVCVLGQFDKFYLRRFFYGKLKMKFLFVSQIYVSITFFIDCSVHAFPLHGW